MESIVMTMPPLPKAYITVSNVWFQNYIGRNVINIHHCYIGEVAYEVCYIEPLGCDKPVENLSEVL